MEIEESTVDEFYYFPTLIYRTYVPRFLDSVKLVSEEYVNIVKNEVELDEIYPSYMSSSFQNDERISDFSSYVIQLAWNVLDSQGYDVSNSTTLYESMWLQEHHKHSLMEQHSHGNGAQIVGFYFLETPENCSKVIFHDPRPAKVQINLPEKDYSDATTASQMINFEPRPGDLFFTNAWLNHSFSRHASEKPLKFVHFNIYVAALPNYSQEQDHDVEVV
jgi:uncharacterized protein (TIGR02466 family)